MTILMVAIVSVCLVSCGKDDDNGNDDVSIVGTWRCDWDSDGSYTIFTFHADGTGDWMKRVVSENKNSSEKFKYAFDVKSMILVLMFWDEEEKDYTDYDEPAHISSLTSKTMIIDGYTYIKQ